MAETRRVPNPRVAVTRELPDAVMLRMEQLFDASIHRGAAALTRGELAAAMADCDVLV
ncbi:MAG: D-glycerate dehydrogenase, partial [Sphingomonas sp.]